MENDSRPSAYPQDWNVIFESNGPVVPNGEGFREPPGLGGGASWAKYKGFEQTAITYPKGTKVYPHTAPVACDLVMDQDVAITLRDGTTIYVDVFRPEGGTDLPTIIAYGPYTKSVPQDPSWVYQTGQVPPEWVSGLAVFEGPDPSFWCAHGYAVVNVDPRGTDLSDGDVHQWGSIEANDGYDVVEWAAQQSWSSGKVALHGVSWLAIVQWFIAAAQPPHLTAIAPWTGHVVDVYREVVAPGGIPNPIFDEMILNSLSSQNRVEKSHLMLERYPLMHPYWEDKVAELHRITVPMYAAGGYGGFEGFPEASSKGKWLRVSETDWRDQYDPERLEDLARFFDHFLKGADNGWEETPRVRLTVFEPGAENQVDIPAADFPLPGTDYRKYYLDADSPALSEKQPMVPSRLTYDAQNGVNVLTVDFDRDTYIVGYPKLHLWVESEGADDMDVFAMLQIVDADGQAHALIPAHGGPGPFGCLRVSLRELDPKLSKDYKPVQSFRERQPLAPGQVVEVDIAILPLGTVLRAGQKLSLMFGGSALQGPMHGQNAGTQVIHTGGERASYLQLPLVQL